LRSKLVFSAQQLAQAFPRGAIPVAAVNLALNLRQLSFDSAKAQGLDAFFQVQRGRLFGTGHLREQLGFLIT
jgi:hypothetical protein